VIAEFLLTLASRSTCKRAQVAALVTDWPDFTAIHAMGYNGRAAGEAHDGCRPNEPGNCGCVHAEMNALVKLDSTLRGLTLVSTVTPCELCARLIVNSRAISRVIYMNDYRSTAGLVVLQGAKIEALALQSRPLSAMNASVLHGEHGRHEAPWQAALFEWEVKA
jgi:dCMP deaminase